MLKDQNQTHPHQKIKKKNPTNIFSRVSLWPWISPIRQELKVYILGWRDGLFHLQKTQVQFPAPILGRPHPPVTPASGDPSLCTGMHIPTHIHRIQNKTNK